MLAAVLAFGPFRLDRDGHRLWRGEDVVPLQAKAFELLSYLAERPGVLVPREELQAALWPDVVVTDQSLRQAVRRVREALGDDEGAPRFVETVPRKGYRFLAPAAAQELPVAVADGPDDLARIDARFRTGARVVTLNGPAGAGKSRLARQYAEQHPDVVVLDEVDDAAERVAAAPGTRFLACLRDGELGVDGEEVLDVDLAAWRPAEGAVVPFTPFVLERRLGEGAVGEAWLARHQQLKDARVFKLCFDPARVRSLRREVALFRVLAQRVGAHPNIVRLHDVRLDAPPWWLVTDYAEGRDLLGWFSPDRPIEARVEVVAQVADALQAAHDAGVLHRDVKPANILVEDRAGKVHARLADFGVGQVLSRDVLAGLTQTGLPATMLAGSSDSGAGTRMYLAPEVIAGEAASPRSDVFSLGVVLWQLVASDLRRALPPDWARHVTDPLLREDLDRCFAGDPAERFASAGELARALRALPARREALARREAEAAAREKAAYRRGVARTAALATVGVALVGGLAVTAWKGRTEAEALAAQERQRLVRAAVEAATDATDAGDPSGALPFAVRALQLVAGDPDAERDARVRIGALIARLPALVFVGSTGANGLHHAERSPDGTRVVAGAPDGSLHLWDVRTGAELASRPGPVQALEVAWRPDGRRIAVANRDMVAVVDAATLAPLTKPLTGTGYTDMMPGMAWEADGVAIRVNGTSGLAWVDPDTAEPIAPLVHPPEGMVLVAATPDRATGIAVAADRSFVPIALATGRALAAPRPLLLYPLGLSLDPTGRRLFRAGPSTSAGRLLSVQGADEWGDVRHAGTLYDDGFSPDGRLLATGAFDQTARLWSAVTGEALTPPLHHLGPVRDVSVTDAGELLTADNDGLVRLWRPTLPDGPQRETLALDREGARRLVRVGGSIACLPTRADAPACPVGLEHMDLGQDVAWQILPDPEWRRIFVVVNEPTERGRVVRGVLYDMETGARLWDGPPQGGWSPDGRVLFASDLTRVARWDEAGGGRLLPLEGPFTGKDLSPDGTRLLVAKPDELVVWDVPGDRVAARFPIPSHGAGWTGDRITIGDGSGTLTVYDAATGQPTGVKLVHPAATCMGSTAPDGRSGVTVSNDGFLRFWDTRDGHPLTPPVPIGGCADQLAYTRDGAHVVAREHDTHVWTVVSARTGLVVARLPRETPRPPFPGPDGFATLWDLDPDPRPIEDLVKVSELYSLRRVDADSADTVDRHDVVGLWRDLADRYPDAFTTR